MNLGQQVMDVLRPLLAGYTRAALIDFPNHSNVGDSAIWLGELAALHALGIQLVYACDRSTYDRDQLRRTLGRGVILLHGGGNFGDVYPDHQHLREKVLTEFRDVPVVQLPQSVHFRDPWAAERAQVVCEAHPQFVLLARENRSLEWMRSRFGSRARLCPDTALCLGPFARHGEASHDVLWLLRTDGESAGHEPPGRGGVTEVADWLDEPPSATSRLSRYLARLSTAHSAIGPVATASLPAIYRWQARHRLKRGLRLLSSAEVVITDRLHGHVLCLLLGIPHVLLDNDYGKLSNFYSTWTSGISGCAWTESPEEALRAVRPYLAEAPPPLGKRSWT